MTLLVAALLVVAQTGSPPTTTPEPAPAAAPKKERKICKEDPATSGTRMSKRLCMTEAEWAQHSHNMSDSSRAGFSGQAQDH